MIRLVAAVAWLVSASVSAQVGPVPGSGDPRFQTIAYTADQVVQLPVAVGYQLTIELSPGERIENAAVGDAGGWQVTANKRGDRLFIRRQSGGAATNLTVMTDTRTYAFDLIPADGGASAPYVVRFVYPDTTPPNAAASPAVEVTGYRMRGDRPLWPSAMGDDGTRTYIEWPSEAAMPAVFTIDDTGQEVTVDGHVRDGRYVIDRVRPKLIFRLGDDSATAERDGPRAPKP